MAAEDIKSKKRKGASDAAPKAKKPRKSDDIAATTTPAKPAKKAAAPTDSKPAKAKPARKQAADLFEKEEVSATEPVKQTKGKKDKAVAKADAMEKDVAEVQEKPKKQVKKSKVVVAVTEMTPVADAPRDKAKKPKKGKQADAAPVVHEEAQYPTPKTESVKPKASKKAEHKEEIIQVVTDADEIEEDAAEDDQTAALLAGFESDGDSEDPEEDLDFDDDIHVPALTAKQRKAVEKAEKASQSNKPGVIYVGRVPRGFFEAQMKKYFSQFGRLNRLRLSRNKKTGASKHYAFVEFASSEVADIVARTMDNYLLFGHILKCKLIPEDQVHPNLFKGAGQRFKVDPRNKKAGLEMERGVERAQWEKRVVNENKRRSGRSKALKEDFGYEYTVPEAKSVEDVPKQDSAVEPAGAPGLLEETPAEQPKSKKGKKGAKVQAAEGIVAEAEVAPEPIADKKTKKEKKRKSDVAVLETTAVTEETVGDDVAPAAAAPKSKKAKKEAKDIPAIGNAATTKRKTKSEQESATKPKKARKIKA